MLLYTDESQEYDKNRQPLRYRCRTGGSEVDLGTALGTTQEVYIRRRGLCHDPTALSWPLKVSNGTPRISNPTYASILIKAWHKMQDNSLTDLANLLSLKFRGGWQRHGLQKMGKKIIVGDAFCGGWWVSIYVTGDRKFQLWDSVRPASSCHTYVAFRFEFLELRLTHVCDRFSYRHTESAAVSIS